jgi:hypothetical protein
VSPKIENRPPFPQKTVKTCIELPSSSLLKNDSGREVYFMGILIYIT